MKKFLVVLMIILSGVVANAATPTSESHKSHLMSLPPFERACVLIRHYETLHKPKHWPTIAYGHVVQKHENYKKRQYTHAEANDILKKDLSKLCAHYRSYGADSLLLACLAYNVGSGRVNKSNLVKKLKSGCRDIHQEYTSFCRYKGKQHKGLLTRRVTEFAALFIP